MYDQQLLLESKSTEVQAVVWTQYARQAASVLTDCTCTPLVPWTPVVFFQAKQDPPGCMQILILELSSMHEVYRSAKCLDQYVAY